MKTPKGIRPKRGKIQIRYQHNGLRHYDMLELAWTPANIEEAVRIRDERLRRLHAGLPPIEGAVVAPRDRSAHTFAEVAQEYLDYVIACDEDDPFQLKVSSRASARELLNLFWLQPLGTRPIERITIEVLKSAVRGVTWSSLKRKRNAFGAVRQVFAYALDDDRGYITDNPAKALNVATRRGSTKKPAPDCYGPADRDRLLAWLATNTSPTIYGYFLIAFYSGMRTGELLALKWDDYDGESFNVEKAIVRGQLTTTKTNESRRVLMPSWVCAIINALPSRFQQRELFLTERGRRYSEGRDLSRHFEDAHKATGVRRSAQPNYPWRHTYASVGLSEGVAPAFLAKQLGHTLTVFYSNYAAWIDSDADREALELAFAKPEVGPIVGPYDTAKGQSPDV